VVVDDLAYTSSDTSNNTSTRKLR